MHVKLLITELRTGGAERCLTELALGLRERGDRVSVMSLMPLPTAPRDELINRLKAEKIPVASAEATNFASLARTRRRVRQWLNDDLPDCLQTFLFHGNVIGAAAAAQAGVGCVVGGVRVAQRNWWRGLLESRASRNLRALVCVSRSVESFVRSYWHPPSSVFVTTIRNGIRPERFTEAHRVDWSELGLAPGGRVILFVGRLHRQKGLDLLLDVAPTLLGLHPDWRLAIVGDGPLEPAVRKTIQRLAPGRACLLEWRSNVADLYAGADIVIVPSRYEGMPNVILEAMASGRCVMSAEVEGVAELLGPEAGKQVFPPGDRGTMVQRLDDLLQSDDLNAIAMANQRRAASEFSIDSMVTRYRDLYEQLLSLPPGQSPHL
jgi:glycosyltransferase involved in cell wall biosynthesis